MLEALLSNLSQISFVESSSQNKALPWSDTSVSIKSFTRLVMQDEDARVKYGKYQEKV